MKQLGKTDIYVSDIIVGGNVFGWTLNENESFSILDEWFENGVHTIDTADNYAHWAAGNEGGESETILGKWMQAKKNRSAVIIATKFGGSYSLNPGKNISAKYAQLALDRSLKRLQTDYIDIYQVHHDDGVTPIEETLSILNEFVKTGKVRAIGVSNMSASKIEASLEISIANGWESYVSVQPEYNYVFREKFESEYLPLVMKYGLGVLPYFSLASGLLTGKYSSVDDLNSKNPSRIDFIKKYSSPENWKLVQELAAESEKAGIPMSAMAIRWLQQQKGVTAPIVSATKKQQIQEILQSRI